MKKLLEAMAPTCCIYDVDFRNLVEEHELGASKVINRKVDFFIVDFLYNVQRNRNADTLEYDLFTLENMRNMATMREDVTMPGVHGHVLCSSL